MTVLPTADRDAADGGSGAPERTRPPGGFDRGDVVAAHRELVEASNGVRHLLVVEKLTEDEIDAARSRLARAYERVVEVDDGVLPV